MNKKFIISGSPFAKGMNGIPRYEFEVLKRLDNLLDYEDIELAIPSDVNFEYTFSKIKIVKLSSKCQFWDLRVLDKYAKKQNAIVINFANNGSRRVKSIVCVHDLIPIKIGGKFKSYYRKSKFVMKFNLRLIKKHSISVITVSQFSKELLSKYLKQDIHVIGNGYEHILDIQQDDNILSKFPQLTKKDYFFTIGNLAPHKNLNWIFENAKKYPDNTYVVAGKAITNVDGFSIEEITNVIFVGYVSDGEMKALLSNAKALLFPTLMEGFGIPPIEALSLGTPAIVSDIPCLKEIYKNSVYYINPYDYKVDINQLLKTEVSDAKIVLQEHTWEKSAQQWYELIKNINV
jgi:glycosyltransferase involved in cell wall biosynthesis